MPVSLVLIEYYLLIKNLIVGYQIKSNFYEIYNNYLLNMNIYQLEYLFFHLFLSLDLPFIILNQKIFLSLEKINGIHIIK